MLWQTASKRSTCWPLEHVLAFGVALQGQGAEVDLEDRHAVLRCLDHGRQAWRQVAAVESGPLIGTEEGANDRHGEPGPGSVRNRLEHRVHLAPGAEQQVAAVVDLVDGVAVAEQRSFLIGEVEAEAQTGAVDPPVADLAQAPYSSGMRQGVCDLGQAFGVGDGGEAVAFLSKGYAAEVATQATCSWPFKIT